MIDFNNFIHYVKHSKLRPWGETLEDQIAQGLSIQRYGDLPDWYAALESLPDVTPSQINLKEKVQIGLRDDTPPATRDAVEHALRKLIPWRKGPYALFDIDIDTEWRSDWKWERLLPHISPLDNRTILDVGCGNGYHMWRMYGEGARRVVGIDPSPRFVVQFYMLKKYMDAAGLPLDTPTVPVDLIPIGIEQLPADLEAFDTTFSMGVLYHRRSPMDHLRELKATLKPGGELVLETLIIEGKNGECLVPEGRYGKMNNVWFLPSAETLISWLRKCGFKNPQCVDQNITSLEEQRVTSWMEFQSLSDFLDPKDPSKTIEGHPAPLRAVFVAQKPS